MKTSTKQSQGLVEFTLPITILVGSCKLDAAGEEFSDVECGSHDSYLLIGNIILESCLRIDPELDSLTPREHEVLLAIARGYTYKEIAGRLHLSVKTIETHVSSVLRKLQLTNRNQITRWAAQRRMI